jgi:hypothetical protein
MGAVRTGLGCTWLSEQSSSEAPTIAGTQDPLYLFACHLEWHHWRNLAAYQALVAALDDSEKRIREMAEMLLGCGPPRPYREVAAVYSKEEGLSWNGFIRLSENKRNGPRAA